MQNHFIKYLIYGFVFIFIIVEHHANARPSPDLLKNAKLYQVSKRNLLSREMEYFKSNPLSTALKSFINRYKRKARYPIKKREKELDKDNMYVVKDGEIVPLRDLDLTTKEVAIVPPMTGEDDRFTVIPLIIHVTVSKDRNDTITCEEEETPDTICREPYTKCRELTTKYFREEPIKREHITRRVVIVEKEETEDEHDTPSGTVNPRLLNRVFDDIKQLISDQELNKGVESTICSVNGDWDSVAGGMQIRITTLNDTRHPEVHLVEREPPMEDGFFKEGNWTLTALVPYTKSSLIVLNAHTLRGKKYLAAFIGECKICDQQESISGHWLIERQSKDCTDRQVSHRFISDVLKKNNVRHLQQEHLNSLVTVPTVPTVAK